MADLKTASLDIDATPAEDTAILSREVDWSVEEEAKAKRKLDLIIMPILILGFFCLRKSHFRSRSEIS
ncbi:Putative transporter-like protein [Tolypocladium paradoxum]|uniref:Transporter-like protein n=1 Tax=Tolypocladium paradoxum TaxID=94208 RepID=A0A2S4KMH8_9HYPO|nr:Putative transporter-like protein [Tolypocladium paradoxum]